MNLEPSLPRSVHSSHAWWREQAEADEMISLLLALNAALVKTSSPDTTPAWLLYYITNLDICIMW